MDTNAKENNEDEDSSTQQVLEYYQKYSQSKQLPKYFSGTSISYLPQIVNEEIVPSNSNIFSKTNKSVPPKTYEKVEPHCELLSPTESVTSNRKLEWDNLGDIGYNNAKSLYKSASLPILTQHKGVKIDDLPKSTNDNVKIVIYPYSSSSEDKISEQNTLQSSSSSPIIEKETPTSSGKTSFQCSEKQQLLSSDSDSSLNVRKIIEFKESISYLKKKIGMPGAHSTPIDSENPKNRCQILPETPFVKKTDKPVKQLIVDTSTEEVNVQSNAVVKGTNSALDIPANSKKKNVNLCITKPVLLDCLSKIDIKQYTIGVQTDEPNKTKSVAKSSEVVTFYNQPETIKTSSDSGKSSSSNAVASKCDSFEYVKNNNECGQSIPVQAENNPAENAKVVINENNKSDNAISEHSENAVKNQDNTNEPKRSDYDIEKNIYVLQRLIQSKKYDSSTKRKYIRKILEKITESKYLEDSSTSSDLFYPKTDPSKILHDQIKNSSFKHENTSSSYQSHDEKKVSPRKKISESTDSDMYHGKEQTTDIKPSTSKSATYVYKKESKPSYKKKLDNTQSVGIIRKNVQPKTSDLKETKKTSFTITNDSSDKSSSSPQSCQNWKQLKTVSEKLLEHHGQEVGGGDQVTQYVDKEREYQLNWIDREINHLGKLKNILEKNKRPYPIPENLKKMTSVYMITASNNDAVHRNYVIETKLGAGPSQQRNFRINGENYIVQDANLQGKVNKGSPPIVADIQVLSTDNTTNIKVTTFCNLCKKSPCVCVADFLQALNHPSKTSDMVKQNLEQMKPGSCSCSCKTTSTSSTSSKNSSHTICSNCHRSPCTCCSCRKIHDIKTCSICHLYSCMCMISPKDSCAGTCIAVKNSNSDSRKSSDTLEKSTKQTCQLCKVYPCICDGDTRTKAKCSTCYSHFCTCKSVSNTTRKPDCQCENSPCSCTSISPKSEIMVCSKCGISSCICKPVSSSYKSSVKTKSLTKLFSDCKCGVSGSCNCEFVDKLLKHFNKDFRLQARVPKSNKHVDAGIQNQVSIYDKLLQDKWSAQENNPALTNTNIDVNSQTGTHILQSKIVEAEKLQSIDEITDTGFKDGCTTTATNAAIITTNPASVELPTTATSSRKSSDDLEKFGKATKYSAVCLCDHKTTSSEKESRKSSYDSAANKQTGSQSEAYSVEKGVDSVDLSVRSNKYDVKTTEDGGDRLYECKTSADKDTLSKVSEIDKDINTGSINNGINTNVFETEKRTGSSITKSVDKGIAANISQGSKGTDVYMLQETADKGTSYRPLLVDQETDYTPRGTSVDQGTSPIHNSARASVDQGTYRNSAIDKETEYTPRTSVDHSTSPRAFEVETAIAQHQKLLMDKCTSPVFYETDRSVSTVPEKIIKDVPSSSGSRKSSREKSSGSKDFQSGSAVTNSSSNSTCCCCGNRVSLGEISLLRSNNKEFPVCEVCIKKRPVLTTICFAGPNEEDTTESSGGSKTVTDRFRRAESYCTCKKTTKAKDFEYCPHCKYQLKKTQKSRNGIAYTLTLENETPEKFRTRTKKKTRKLEEIKMKVPNPYNRKKHKNKENNFRRDEDKMKILESADDSENEHNVYITKNVNYPNNISGVSETLNNEKDSDQYYTLQEYLQKNRPNFVDAAEYRRLALINNKIERELNKDEQKLRFLEENVNNNRLKRQKLFTEQEMREITKRNYKKLPEVQQKLTNQRREKLRSADRFMADMLNRKIQNCVLKGKRSFPIDTNVVNVS